MTDYKKLTLVQGWNLVSSFDLNVNLDDIKKPNGLIPVEIRIIMQ